MRKPVIAITMGDPAGIGPEIIVRAWADPRTHAICAPVVVGHPAVMERAARLVGFAGEVRSVDSPTAASSSVELITCVTAAGDESAEVAHGAVDPRGGQAAYDCLIAAARLALAERVDAITTAPLSKAALHAAGHHYPGHTELLAELCEVDDFAMMLYLAQGDTVRGAAGLGVAHVTLHMGLRQVMAHLSSDAVLAKIMLAHRVMSALKEGPPRVGVMALNPHGGESGLFGDEEMAIIAPAVERAAAQGVDASGPYPADTLMVRARDGEFDGVVAMYHDQGHIALKLLGMHRAVNITLGLPIVRTSVAHGTAFDIAGLGRAQHSSMIEALRVAAILSKAKR